MSDTQPSFSANARPSETPVARRVAFVLFDQALGLNLHGPAEVFDMANIALRGHPAARYELLFLSESGGGIRTSSGMVVQTQALCTIDPSHLDTLIVVGGLGASAFARGMPLVDWIARASTLARRVCSVCNGAFLLAAAGLLDGRRAVTHACEADALQRMYPEVQLASDPIYLRDGSVWTSAGMSAAIDLALALVEDDHGRRLGMAVAKDLVVFSHRAGEQPQFSSVLAAQTRLGTQSPGTRLTALPAWIADNLDAKLGVDALADAVGMTPRTFARHFARWHGGTPARLVQRLRVEAACRHLDSGDVGIKRIAQVCGFEDEERMRRAFMRELGVPPARYRNSGQGAHPPRAVLGAV